MTTQSAYVMVAACLAIMIVHWRTLLWMANRPKGHPLQIDMDRTSRGWVNGMPLPAAFLVWCATLLFLTNGQGGKHEFAVPLSLAAAFIGGWLAQQLVVLWAMAVAKWQAKFAKWGASLPMKLLKLPLRLRSKKRKKRRTPRRLAPSFSVSAAAKKRLFVSQVAAAVAVLVLFGMATTPERR